MRCTQNKFTIFCHWPIPTGSGRVGSGKSWVGSGWVTKSDPCPTLTVLCYCANWGKYNMMKLTLNVIVGHT